MERRTTLAGLAVALLLTIGCEGAPSQNVEARSILADTHIIMGKEAKIEDFPYQISILVMFRHACGGAIVSKDYVITAAHCIDPRISGPTTSKYIRAGSSTSASIGDGGQTHQIAEAKHHPKFSLETFDYDIGVIKVSKKFVFSDRIRPIAVPLVGEDYLDYSSNATVSGWGMAHLGSQSPSYYLQVVEIPLVRRMKCLELYAEAPAGYPNDITTRMLCGAGTGKGGPCHGDSGGPLVQNGQLIGLVSGSVRCNDVTFPTVFANVLNDEIRAFIQKNAGI